MAVTVVTTLWFSATEIVAVLPAPLLVMTGVSRLNFTPDQAEVAAVVSPSNLAPLLLNEFVLEEVLFVLKLTLVVLPLVSPGVVSLPVVE